MIIEKYIQINEYDTTIIEIIPEIDKISNIIELDEDNYKKSNLINNNE